MTKLDGVRYLRKDDGWRVDDVRLRVAQAFVRQMHYAGRGSNTGTFVHGLYSPRGAVLGIAWWIPPTKTAAINACKLAGGGDWRRCLSLSRVVVAPPVPVNGASFLLAASVNLIREGGNYDVGVTYADESVGHTGAIYRATNWIYAGMTTPEATWVDDQGRRVARKAGGRTRTKAEMEDLGYTMIGRARKHRFVIRLDR